MLEIRAIIYNINVEREKMTKNLKEALSYISKIQEKGNRFIVEQLNKNGIKELVPSHGDILAVLYKDGKTTMKEIADKIHRTKPNVTVLVNKLKRLGYVKREDSKTDSRYTYIVLTQKGKSFETVFKDISKKLNKKLYKNFSDNEYKKFETYLKKAFNNLK